MMVVVCCCVCDCCCVSLPVLRFVVRCLLLFVSVVYGCLLFGDCCLLVILVSSCWSLFVVVCRWLM